MEDALLLEVEDRVVRESLAREGVTRIEGVSKR